MAVAIAALVGLPSLARAQEQCDPDAGVPPGSQGVLEQTFPGSNEVNVPVDGFVRLRYRYRAPSRAFVAVSEQTNGRAVLGDAVVVGNEVHWHARGTFSSNTDYTVHASDLSGTDTTISFRTGFDTSEDRPPTFNGIRDVAHARLGTSDLCGDPNALEVTVSFDRVASSRWPVTDIEYVIYQTAGPRIGGPVERARERGRMSGGPSATTQTRSFRLASTNAAGALCFNVQALDPYGRADGNAVERCLNPASGNVFVGCHASHPSRESGRATAGIAIAAAVSAASRRRRAR